jgi:hypothetical protein
MNDPEQAAPAAEPVSEPVNPDDPATLAEALAQNEAHPYVQPCTRAALRFLAQAVADLQAAP